MIGEFIDCTIYEISKTLSQNNQIGHFPQNTKIFNPLLEKKKKRANSYILAAVTCEATNICLAKPWKD